MSGILGRQIIKTGIAKISSGAQQFSIPTTATFLNVGTSTIAVNSVRYVPFKVEYPITITAHAFEVTTTPASLATVHLGIYAADTDQQPTGAPLLDSTVTVANGFTGVKTTSSLSVSLPAGMYLMCINTDVSFVARTFVTGAYSVVTTLGATPMNQRYEVAQTLGAFPTPGTAWTAVNGSAGGLQNFMAFQWTE